MMDVRDGELPTAAGSSPLQGGERIGRFMVLRDNNGHIQAVAAGSVAAACETDEGTLLMLPGGRMVHVPRPMVTVLAWPHPSSSPVESVELRP